MTFAQCRAYLDKLQVLGIKLGLDNVRALLQALGRPDRSFPSIVVAGTNGKGSVCAMLAAALRRHGLRVGLYTSPHLVEVRERIRLGSRLISRTDFCRAVSAVKTAADRLLAGGKTSSPPTHFEALTCAALLHFRERRADIAVLEVGMGGRFDAVNAVTPVLSVVTSIGMDHERYLGPTPERIAAEKAGIVKRGVPVVCGVPPGPVADIIRNRARIRRAPYTGVLDPPRRLRALKKGAGHEFVYGTGRESFRFSPRLAGRHQGLNGAVALAAALELGRAWRPLDARHILAGIGEAEWPGRLEIARRSPTVILDGAHNIDGAAAVREYVREFVKPPLVLVFAAMRDKDIAGMARILFPPARRIILTSFPFHRAADPQSILRFAGRFSGRVVLEPDPRRAVRLSLAEAKRLRGTVLIAGSLFLVGEAKKALRLNYLD
jgi:dihydrofolate synthase/folylpolyglutamate synthase